jgi:predicted enzyme related to lactoylglutathione lyase
MIGGIHLIEKLTHVTVVVDDYDRALTWYTEKLGFEVQDNAEYGPGYRWVTIRPREQQDVVIVLHQPHETETALQTGNVSHWVFSTRDCRKTVEELRSRGVKIVHEPEEVPWGVQATFEDLYGNHFVLVQPAEGIS